MHILMSFTMPEADSGLGCTFITGGDDAPSCQITVVNQCLHTYVLAPLIADTFFFLVHTFYSMKSKAREDGRENSH